MADIVIDKVLCGELIVDDLLEWLAETFVENQSSKDFSEFCSRKDFITYFLNLLHDISVRNQTESVIGLKDRINSTENSRIKSSLFNGSSIHNSRKSSSSNDTTYSLQNTFNLSCTTSTPNNEKSLHNGSFDKDYSPIQSSSNSNHGTFNLGDFIVKNKKSSSKKKSSKKGNNVSVNIVENKTVRKLKPTNLNDSKFNSIELKSGNSFSFQNNIEEISRENVKCDFMTREISVPNNKLEIKKVNDLSEEESKLKPDKQKNSNPKTVRYKTEIEKIVRIYEFFINNGFVLSLIGELYFIMTLLLSKNFCDTNECDEEIISHDVVSFGVMFNRKNNITFFAVSMLEKIDYLLECLDNMTLRYLCDNENLKLYSPELIQKLHKIIEQKAECMLNLYNSNGKNNICFVLETDNLSNFPSDISFQGFKRQRDMFYEILKLWETNHMQPNWDFEVALGRRIKSLVSYHKDPVNYVRLSRLFMEQLLNASSKKEISTDNSSALLSSLSNLDKDKIDRLKNRLMKKTTNGINSELDFCGYQEFFKEFIDTSYNPTFTRHLCNVFIAEILELNGTTFDTLNTESNENEAELDTKKAFVGCLKSLKTLAKFLGYIESIPYKNENTHTPELMNFQVKIRNQVSPSMSIHKLLEDASSQGYLTLLIPWLCEYLSMLDIVTLRTKYYNEVIETMIKLYRSIIQTNSFLPSFNSLLIKFSLGWFFELNNFPHNLFFENLIDQNILKTELKCSVGLDRLNIVDNNILYIFCPFLEEFRRLLANETTTNNRITSRHITPLSKVEPAKETIKKKIEQQLEEAFFHSHPSSLKKTVDFVAERIASTCVKHLCYNVVPEYKKKFIYQLQMKMKQWSNEELDESELNNRGTKLAEDEMIVLGKLCDEEVNNIIQNRVKASLVALLPIDFLPQMEAVCISVTERMCREKVQQWASTHIVIGLLTKEVKTEMKQFHSIQRGTKPKPSYVLPPSGSDVTHDPDTKSGPHTLNRIRLLSASVLTNSEEIQEELLIEVLEDVYKTINLRNDLSQMVIKTICSQLVDLLILFVAYQPTKILKAKEYFFKIWKQQRDSTEELFENFISLKNFAVTAMSGPWEESINVKASICVELIHENILTSECFESQCMGLFQQELDSFILKIIISFLKIFVEIYRKRYQSSKFTYLLEFLSDYCSDL
ncbi:codanin-1 [Harmonia axyridis]|uniref:codanin-1 n=1 Tax=Harmonia axyridis TaxID=115357 RepID=UPI001E275D23|nr:codanin-1 [Harmonia axyridis]